VHHDAHPHIHARSRRQHHDSQEHRP
jgi:hypothetical protein